MSLSKMEAKRFQNGSKSDIIIKHIGRENEINANEL